MKEAFAFSDAKKSYWIYIHDIDLGEMFAFFFFFFFLFSYLWLVVFIPHHFLVSFFNLLIFISLKSFRVAILLSFEIAQTAYPFSHFI